VRLATLKVALTPLKAPFCSTYPDQFVEPEVENCGLVTRLRFVVVE
jgi:hypothetical protein